MYPDSYIEFLSYLKVGLDIRKSPSHSLNTSNPCSECAQIMILSMVKLELIATNEEELPTTIVNCNGISATEHIEQMRRRERRKFIKLHIMAG
ncbi:MAG: hypothetical protein QW837_04415 [Conexivisphaerales archaeon]